MAKRHPSDGARLRVHEALTNDGVKVTHSTGNTIHLHHRGKRHKLTLQPLAEAEADLGPDVMKAFQEHAARLSPSFAERKD